MRKKLWDLYGERLREEWNRSNRRQRSDQENLDWLDSRRTCLKQLRITKEEALNLLKNKTLSV